jgi:hypothetical protein
VRADPGQVLRAHATGALDYGRHLIRQAEAANATDDGRCRVPRIGAMAAEQLEIAARAIVALHEKGLA